MQNKIELDVTIKSTTDAVWDALTNPDKIELYLAGQRCDSNWKPGSKANFYIKGKVKDIVVSKGEVIRSEPGKLLEYTRLSKNADVSDTPENYVLTTYELYENGTDSIDLKVTHKGYAYVENGRDRYIENIKVWKNALPKIKDLVES